MMRPPVPRRATPPEAGSDPRGRDALRPEPEGRHRDPGGAGPRPPHIPRRRIRRRPDGARPSGAKARPRVPHDAGFTLIELLIVLVIVGLLAAFVGPSLYQQINPARATAARSQIDSFMTALDNYLIDVGSYPTTEQGLEALRTDPGVAGWRGPYLRKEVPLDPWGTDYVYRAPGRSGGFEIVSYGADGLEGGSDEAADLESWRG